MIPYVIGFLFSVPLGAFLIWGLTDAMWKRMGWRPGIKNDTVHPYPEFSIITGLFERTLYTSAFLAGFKEFIGVWLAFKVAARWKAWDNDQQTGQKYPGRSIFNIFLVGNAASLAFASMGWKIIIWLRDGLTLKKAVWAGVSLIAAVSILWIWEFCLYSRAPRKIGDGSDF